MLGQFSYQVFSCLKQKPCYHPLFFGTLKHVMKCSFSSLKVSLYDSITIYLFKFSQLGPWNFIANFRVYLKQGPFQRTLNGQCTGQIHWKKEQFVPIDLSVTKEIQMRAKSFSPTLCAQVHFKFPFCTQ